MFTATELELLACFGSEPQLLDKCVPWCYNRSTYAAKVDGLSVQLTITPSYRDVRIVVTLGEQRIFEFNSMDVADLQVIDELGVDTVVVKLSEESCLRLQLRPNFEIAQEFTSQVAREGRKGSH